MIVEFLPKGIICDIGVPGDGARVGKRHFLAFAELVRGGKIEKLVILVFRESLPSSLDGPLHASIFALDRLRDIYPA
jgi:hypothetical protein